MARKPLSKKIRFEVFKRDKFTCQYCGRMSPDVILEVDHIEPVAEGGDNEITNLITSCRDCNRGKGKTRILDSKAISFQQEALKDLAEKKEQLEMIAEWKKELLDYDNMAVNMLTEYFEQLTGCDVNDNGRKEIGIWLKRFSADKIMEAMEKSVKSYCKEFSYDEIVMAFSKIPGVCINHSKGDNKSKYYFNYIKKVLTSRGIEFNPKLLKYYVETYLITEEDFAAEKKSKRYLKIFVSYLHPRFDKDKFAQNYMMDKCFVGIADIDGEKSIENLKYGLDLENKGYFFSDRYSPKNRVSLIPYLNGFTELLREYYREYYQTYNEPHPVLTTEQGLRLLNHYASNKYWANCVTKEDYCNMFSMLKLSKKYGWKEQMPEAMFTSGGTICDEKIAEYESEERKKHDFRP